MARVPQENDGIAWERRQGDSYRVSEEEIAAFHRDGYVHLQGVLAEDEIAQLEREFMAFLRREIRVEGRDFCDMSADYSKPVESFSIINIMLPSKYNPSLKGNIYQRRAASISQQLLGDGMVFDYDQLLAKPPNKPDAEFKWHQDLAYWPVTKDTRTASFWLAIDDSTIQNGCLQFVPGTHLEHQLRDHGPAHGDREKSHTLFATLAPADAPKAMEIRRGDVTVHHERLLHGSSGNLSSDSWRRAWVIAFRSKETVEEERRIGFTHSHNDKLEVLNSVGREGDSNRDASGISGSGQDSNPRPS
ncbi:phytanoyl-CoA dioxygenase, peroxisomal [Selaginella moellendorffii]|nr:phytanoyl-CoA dioxygenase, peroxisomal [Selaginella moellendorffii]|eukprot:XP_002968187.2 phytanoyl-CoA dioxygenase, peroxisomal [Selaginella moellendorffii]